MALRAQSRRGNTLLEFTLVGIPIIFMIISVFSVAIDMWQFYNMEYAVCQTAHYAAMHGRTCSQSPNTCTITVGNVATFFQAQTFALDASKAVLSLTSLAGTTTCNPLSTCLATGTQWPSSTANGVNSDISIKVSYPMSNPIAMFWPGKGSVQATNFSLFASSKQRIIF